MTTIPQSATFGVPEHEPVMWAYDVIERAEDDPELTAADVVEVRALVWEAVALSLSE